MTAPHRPPTLQDVAARAGVSHQTVSRFLNLPATVKADTRERIADAIGELGYRRNLAALTLASRRSRALGVLAPEVSDYGPTSTIHALGSAARERGYRIVVSTFVDRPGSVDEALSLLMQQAVEAIIVVAPGDATATVTAASTGRPVISTGFIDQRAGIGLAMRHLIGLGHRRIQHVAGPPHYLEARHRRDAFAAAVRDAGLPALPIVDGDWSARAGYRAAGRIEEGTTAVCCANDQMALGLISGLLARGLRVPDDVSVAGFDDVPEASYFRPPLTTVRQDFGRVGALAIDAVVLALTGEGGIAGTVEPVLVRRASTRPATFPRSGG